MKRILLLTGILILAFTAAAFADDDSTAVTLTVGEFFSINSPATASHALTEAELDFGSVEFDAGSDIIVDANTAYQITGTWVDLAGATGEAIGDNVDLDVNVDGDGFVEAGTDVVLVATNAAADAQALDLDFRCEGLTFASVPPGSYTTTVTFTIAAD